MTAYFVVKMEPQICGIFAIAAGKTAPISANSIAYRWKTFQ